ncbi:serine hydrolase, partial [Candidatus Frankia alpina]|uniref:serine hydrolase n=1 Tax=Candidatus Frankia alpina TaxID=2699483 RepID=UPI001F165603
RLATVEPIAAARRVASTGLAARRVASTGLAARLRSYLAGRPGHVSVAMYDAVAGTTAVYTDPAVAGYETASSAKLDILTALVQRAGASGRLTAREQALARRMISVSDNAAASALWADVGGAPAMNAFFARLGMHATTAGPGGKWGLTRITGADQLAVLRAISYPGTLSAAGRATVSGLLKTVRGLTGRCAGGGHSGAEERLAAPHQRLGDHQPGARPRRRPRLRHGRLHEERAEHAVGHHHRAGAVRAGLEGGEKLGGCRVARLPGGGWRRAAAAGPIGRPSRFFAVCCRRVLSSSPVACSGPGAVPRPATGVRTYCECGVAAAARDQRLKRATARILFIASSAATL